MRLWDWALEVYARQPVAEACLHLQDARGVVDRIDDEALLPAVRRGGVVREDPVRGATALGRGEIPTIDSLIAEHIGTRTRFRSIEVACTRRATDSFSTRGGNVLDNNYSNNRTNLKRIRGK